MTEFKKNELERTCEGTVWAYFERLFQDFFMKLTKTFTLKFGYTSMKKQAEAGYTISGQLLKIRTILINSSE
jgi:hypothetical protein